MSRDLRAGALLGQRVCDPDGTVIGRVADLETQPDDEGRERIVAVLVTAGPWGRLLGYEREQVKGPWLLEWCARRIMRRDMHRIPWDEAHLSMGE
jgi:sporulation protein YlmC with PRC-barrel domain